MSEHFDAATQVDARSPDGFEKVAGVGAVLVNRESGQVVITGSPGPDHDCDARGCGSVEHKIAEFKVDSEVFSNE